MYRGYIKLWRKIKDSFVWHDSECLKLMIHLLMEANYKDTEFIFNNKKMTLKRGQLICGRQALERELGIQESKIYRLLSLLEGEQLIEQQKTNLYTIVSIVNYNLYQSDEQQIEQPVNNQRTTSEQPVNTSKELIRTNKELIINTSSTPDVRYIQTYFYDKYKERVGSEYTPSWAKDTLLIKNLLKTVSKDDLINRINLFFESKDKFIQEAGYTLGVFNGTINKFVVKQTNWNSPAGRL